MQIIPCALIAVVLLAPTLAIAQTSPPTLRELKQQQSNCWTAHRHYTGSTATSPTDPKFKPSDQLNANLYVYDPDWADDCKRVDALVEQAESAERQNTMHQQLKSLIERSK